MKQVMHTKRLAKSIIYFCMSSLFQIAVQAGKEQDMSIEECF